MPKKSRIFRVASLLLVLCFISTVMISGTFAKYTSEYSGSDTALVARWSFDGFVGQNPAEAATELDLFKHAYDKHINQTNESTVDPKYIIAPGVDGEFVVAMDYLADVDADVTINIKGLDNNANVTVGEGDAAVKHFVPVKYSVDEGSTWVTLENLPGALVEAIINTEEYEDYVGVGDIDGSLRIEKVGSNVNAAHSISQTVQWEWPYDVNADQDEIDTLLGEKSNAAGLDRIPYGIEIKLTAEQVLPVVDED